MLKTTKSYLWKICFNYYIYNFREVRDFVRKFMILKKIGLKKPFGMV